MNTYLKHLASLAVVAVLLAAPVSAQSDYHWKLRFASPLASPVGADIAFFDDLRGMVAVNWGVYVTDDGGLHWEYIRLIGDTATHSPLTSIAIVDGNTAWVCGWSGKLFVTRDAGATFEDRSIAPEFNMNSIFFLDPLTGFIAGESDATRGGVDAGAILRTLDGGASWDLVQTFPPQNYSLWVIWNKIAFADAEHGWVAGSRGMVASTRDGGDTWKIHEPGVSMQWLGMHVYSANHVMITGESQRIAETTDGGVTWVAQPRLPGSLVINDVVIRADGTGWLGTKSQTTSIFRTEDNGTTWLPETLVVGEYRTVVAIAYTADDRVFALTSDGRVYERIGEGITNIRGSVPLAETPALQVYPAPLGSGMRMKLQITMPGSENTRIGLYTADGRYIAMLFEGMLGEGRNVIEPLTKPLVPGVYFLLLRTATGSHVSRFLVIGR